MAHKGDPEHDAEVESAIVGTIPALLENREKDSDDYGIWRAYRAASSMCRQGEDTGRAN
jgi:hypothetical protein